MIQSSGPRTCRTVTMATIQYREISSSLGWERSIYIEYISDLRRSTRSTRPRGRRGVLRINNSPGRRGSSTTGGIMLCDTTSTRDEQEWQYIRVDTDREETREESYPSRPARVCGQCVYIVTKEWTTLRGAVCGVSVWWLRCVVYCWYRDGTHSHKNKWILEIEYRIVDIACEQVIVLCDTTQVR
jgi:hypothetical protein